MRTLGQICAVATLLACLGGIAAGSAAAEPVLPSGFQDTVVPFEGLQAGQGIEEPTVFRFAPDGKVFVGEKSGKILVYASLADHTPTLFADLRTEVYNGNDRGLLGLALDPQFSEAHPYVYVLYAYDHELGEAAPPPRWGNPGEDGDGCPEPPGVETDGCVISGRLSRLTANLTTDKSTEEKPLITDWCQQFSSHSVGNLEFDAEGNLWASGGEGASFTKVDWGQYGFPQVNPCGDPPRRRWGPGGTTLCRGRRPALAELAKTRRQDHSNRPRNGRRRAGQPARRELRRERKRTQDRRQGLPQPLPLRHRSEYERSLRRQRRLLGIRGDRPLHPSPTPLFNSGWPCYEGPEQAGTVRVPRTDVCDGLTDARVRPSQPFYYYSHDIGVTPDDPCPYKDGSAISGLASTRAAPTPKIRRRPFLRRCGARLHLCDADRGRTAGPTPRRSSRS